MDEMKKQMIMEMLSDLIDEMEQRKGGRLEVTEALPKSGEIAEIEKEEEEEVMHPDGCMCDKCKSEIGE